MAENSSRERPILFQGAMVRALLAGTKTQTRRAVKPQPPTPEAVHALAGIDYCWIAPDGAALDYHRPAGPVWAVRQLMGCEPQLRCPYGQPGDRLWVREAWRVSVVHDHVPGGELGFGTTPQVQYEAIGDGNDETGVVWGRYRHARFMPRWASRITLEVTAVRVERLQEISEADAEAEGVTKPRKVCEDDPGTHIDAYADLWEQINGRGSWDDNPWVWVVEFRRIPA